MNLIASRLYLSFSVIVVLALSNIFWNESIGRHNKNIKKHERALKYLEQNSEYFSCMKDSTSSKYGSCEKLEHFQMKTSLSGSIFKFITYITLTILSLWLLKKWFFWAFNLKRQKAPSSGDEQDEIAS